MNRRRFIIRRLMIAGAIVALLFGGWAGLYRRAERFRQTSHDDANATKIEELTAIVSGHRYGYRSTNFRALQENYRWAAEHPWLPWIPDTSAPCAFGS